MTETGTGRHPLVTVLGLLRADAPGDIERAPQAWPRWAVLLPHVLAATSHLPTVPGQSTPGGDDASWLLDAAAAYLQVHARLTEARPLQERALAITEAAYGPDHPAVAVIRGNLSRMVREADAAKGD